VDGLMYIRIADILKRRNRCEKNLAELGENQRDKMIKRKLFLDFNFNKSTAMSILFILKPLIILIDSKKMNDTQTIKASYQHLPD
jgi:hypothetical protein